MTSLDKKTILITGAGGGFGREMVRQFLAEGAYLLLSDLNMALMLAAVTEATAGGPLPGRVLGFIEADLARPEGADQLYRRCVAITPQLDMLVNNAGIGYYGQICDVPREHWERLMQINLLAPMRLTALFLPAMIARRSGHIVNISSVAGLLGSPGLSAYSAAKFGLRGFGEALHADLHRFGIAVTNIYPFYSRTAILDAEQFGVEQLRRVPQKIVYEPAFVIAELIKGIKRGELHVYPGAIPRAISRLSRIAPRLSMWLTRKMAQ